MSNIRLFFSSMLSLEMTDKLNKSQSHYLTKVMRVRENEVFSLFNKDGEWEAEILSVSKSIVKFKTIKQLRQKENTNELWLAFSPIKSNYQNFMIQKATELGITKFLPIISERTIVRKINLDRLNKIVIEATEQSNRITIPTIEKIISLENFIQNNSGLNIIFADLNTDNKNLNVKSINNKPICILIGPEGDFSENERKKILDLKNVQPLKLNNNILRTETATISALSIINFCLDL